jgi:hypothetical protein
MRHKYAIPGGGFLAYPFSINQGVERDPILHRSTHVAQAPLRMFHERPALEAEAPGSAVFWSHSPRMRLKSMELSAMKNYRGYRENLTIVRFISTDGTGRKHKRVHTVGRENNVALLFRF